MASVDKVRRLLSIVAVLQSGRAVNARELAEENQVSKRTILRDLESLRDCGLNIDFNRKRQSFKLTSNRFLAPTDLTPDEAMALIVLCQELADGDKGIPYLQPARTAAFKLASVLPRQIRQTLIDTFDSHRVRIAAQADLSESQEIYEAIRQAFYQRHPLKIEYRSFTEQEVLKTTLRPYCFYFNRRSWYVIGRSSIHRQVRTFHLKRFLQVTTLTDQTYQIPERFSLDDYFGNAWQMIREKDRPFHVIVRFAPMVAGNVAEVQWHKTQRIEQLDDGSVDFHVDVEGLSEISWWILGYGHQAKVLEPRELQDMIRQHAEKMLTHYT